MTSPNYLLTLDPEVAAQLNPILQSISDRLSQLEGIRGKPAMQDFATDEGSADRYIINPYPPWQSDQIVAGVRFRFVPNETSTGASTFTVSGTEYDIKKDVSSDITAGDIVADKLTELVFDGQYMQYVAASTVNLSTDVTGDLPYANLAQGSALSVLGVAGNSAADNASIVAASDHQVMRRSGTAIAFGAVNLAQSAAITGDLPFANLAQGSALSVLGVTGNATADNASIAASTDHQVMRRNGTAVAFGAVNLAQSAAVTGVLPTANGGISVDIASAALPLGSGQITFPATQNASADVNTLDDYEEGSWTPVLWDASLNSSESQTYSVQVGRYVKIGLNVAYWCRITTSGLGTLTTTDTARIGGLPFTSENTTNLFGGVTVQTANGLAVTAGNAGSGTLVTNTTHLELRKWSATTGTSAMTITEWSADGDAVIWGNYRAAA